MAFGTEQFNYSFSHWNIHHSFPVAPRVPACLPLEAINIKTIGWPPLVKSAQLWIWGKRDSYLSKCNFCSCCSWIKTSKAYCVPIMSTYCVQVPHWAVLFKCSHGSITKTQQGRSPYSHFINEESKYQRLEAASPRPHIQLRSEHVSSPKPLPGT